MKKLFLFIPACAIIFSCGSRAKKDVQVSDKDTTQKDTGSTTVITNNSGAKDYSYWASKFKNPTIEGIELKQKQLTDHSEDLEIHISNYVTNASEVGFDELTFSTVNPAMYSGEQKDRYEKFSKENFEFFQNLDETLPKITATEYTTGDMIFFYCIRKNNKGFMGKKDYNGLTLEAKSGNLILSMYITVFDLKSDMKKAEDGAKKVADWIAN